MLVQLLSNFLCGIIIKWPITLPQVTEWDFALSLDAEEETSLKKWVETENGLCMLSKVVGDEIGAHVNSSLGTSNESLKCVF